MSDTKEEAEEVSTEAISEGGTIKSIIEPQTRAGNIAFVEKLAAHKARGWYIDGYPGRNYAVLTRATRE